MAPANHPQRNKLHATQFKRPFPGYIPCRCAGVVITAGHTPATGPFSPCHVNESVPLSGPGKRPQNLPCVRSAIASRFFLSHWAARSTTRRLDEACA
eukprot:360457-Chlamydomonas_euryale.AAC.4